jgi:hypothetical protein
MSRIDGDKFEHWENAEIHEVDGRVYEIVPTDCPYPSLKWRVYYKGKYFTFGKDQREAISNIGATLTHRWWYWNVRVWEVLSEQVDHLLFCLLIAAILFSPWVFIYLSILFSGHK